MAAAMARHARAWQGSTTTPCRSCGVAPHRIAAAPPRAPRHACSSQWTALIAATGDVNAPIGVLVGGAIVITIVATAIVPLALNPGQNAAEKIFSGDLLKKRTTVRSSKLKRRD